MLNFRGTKTKITEIEGGEVKVTPKTKENGDAKIKKQVQACINSTRPRTYTHTPPHVLLSNYIWPTINCHNHISIGKPFFLGLIYIVIKIRGSMIEWRYSCRHVKGLNSWPLITPITNMCTPHCQPDHVYMALFCSSMYLICVGLVVIKGYHLKIWKYSRMWGLYAMNWSPKG